jgi:hypothetical protein
MTSGALVLQKTTTVNSVGALQLTGVAGNIFVLELYPNI